MRRAIRKHLGDFVALFAMTLLSIGIGAYILSHQRLRFPFIEEKPFVVKAVLPDAQAVQPGQGQTVRTAGIEIGQIGKVELEDGRAVVELQLERKYDDFIKEDATALLRTKTGLKDMFIEVDPGVGKALEENERIEVQNTLPDIDPDEILAALDTDTRDYLKLLVSGAGKGLRGRGTDLRETFARLGPLNRDLGRVTSAIARRRQNLRRLVNRYGKLTVALGDKDSEIVRLVTASNSVFEALASQEAQVSEAVHELPAALEATQGALAKVDTLSGRLGPALEALRPPIRKLASANASVLPLVREATPQIRDQIRPFARIAGPYTRDLGIASRDLAKAGPDLTQSFEKLNRLFNLGAYNPNGREDLAGKSFAEARDRSEGYLYWLAWVANNTTSLFNTADDQGVFRRVVLGGVACDSIALLIGAQLPPLQPILNDTVIPLLASNGVCAK